MNLPHRVVWQEPSTTTDRYGNTVVAFIEPTGGWPQIDAWIQQQSSTEQRDGRDTIVSTWMLFTNEIGVTARARIVWDSHVFDVDGVPHIVSTRRGTHHVEARLRLVEG